MPDPATPMATDAPVTQTAAPEQTPAPSAAQPQSPAPDPGRIDPAKDFDHPEYGKKVKNAYDGMTKAQADAAEHKKQVEAYKGTMSAINKMVESDPKVAASMVGYLESTGQSVPPRLKELAAKQAAPQGHDDDDSQPMTKAEWKKWQADQEADRNVRDALTAFQTQLGGGDIGKGTAVYHKDQADLLKIMSDELDSPNMAVRLKAAHDLLNLRRAAQRPATTPEPSAASDMGRATGGAPAGTEPLKGPPSMQQWLAAAGFSSEEAFLRSLREG